MSTEYLRTFSALSTREEFIQRYLFMKTRIKSGFTADGLAFLIGKPPFFIVDYEESNGINIFSKEDLEALSSVSQNSYLENVFKANKRHENSNEKKLIRGKRELINGYYQYTLMHSWLISGENKPFILSENIRIHASNENKKLVTSIFLLVRRLVNEDFFELPKIPMEIYRALQSYRFHKAGVLASLLKEVMLELVRLQELSVSSISKGMCFQRK